MKLVDLGQPTSFFDHVYLECTQRERKSNESFVDEYREMFESRISAGVSWLGDIAREYGGLVV